MTGQVYRKIILADLGKRLDSKVCNPMSPVNPVAKFSDIGENPIVEMSMRLRRTVLRQAFTAKI